VISAEEGGPGFPGPPKPLKRVELLTPALRKADSTGKPSPIGNLPPVRMIESPGDAATGGIASMQAVEFAALAAELDALYRTSRAPSTGQKMRQVLREFGALPGVATSADLTPPNVARFVVYGRSRDRAESTLRTLLSYLRRACSYAVGRGVLATSPFAAWGDYLGQAPGESESEEAAAWGEPTRHLPAAQIDRVLAHLRALRPLSWHDHRLYALASLVAYTGLRRGEALRLRWQDVRIDERLIRVSRRSRLKRATASDFVAIPDKLAAVLKAWKKAAGDSGWVVPNVRGKGPWTGGMGGYKPLDRLKQAAAAAGVGKFTFSMLRHSWATHAESLWDMGEGLIQRNMRHSQGRTTKGYRHPDVANLVAAARSIDFSPRA
jgi:integrase